MATIRKHARRAAWLWLLLPVVLSGCWSYVSKDAKQQFQGREGRFSVTVYPVNVVRGTTLEHDPDLAISVMTFLNEEGLAQPMLADAGIEIPVTWGSNQAKMAQQRAQAFARAVKEAGIHTEYALLVEILCDARETRVAGVHFYLSDRGGLLASGGLTNSIWKEFKEVRPTDRQGGLEVLKRMLRKRWKQD